MVYRCLMYTRIVSKPLSCKSEAGDLRLGHCKYR